jgi:hypothetical protein
VIDLLFVLETCVGDGSIPGAVALVAHADRIETAASRS